MFEKIPESIGVSLIGLGGVFVGYILSYYVQRKTIYYQLTKERQISTLEAIYNDLLDLQDNLENGVLETSLEHISKYINTAKFIPLKESKGDFLEILDLNKRMIEQKRMISNLISLEIHKFLGYTGQYHEDYGYSCVPYSIPDAFIVAFILDNPKKFESDIVRYIEKSQEMGINENYVPIEVDGFRSNRPEPKVTKKHLDKFKKMFDNENIKSKISNAKDYYSRIRKLTNKTLQLVENKIKR